MFWCGDVACQSLVRFGLMELSKIQERIGDSYLVLPGFISLEEVEKLRSPFLTCCKDLEVVHDDGIVFNSRGVHQHIPSSILMCTKLKQVIALLGEPCVPSYSYIRSYGHLAELRPHADRASCEISITVHLGGDQEWSFLIDTVDGTAHRVNLNPGDAILFDGINFPHCRENPYGGVSYEQLFLHYVFAEGDYTSHMFEPPGKKIVGEKKDGYGLAVDITCGCGGEENHRG